MACALDGRIKDTQTCKVCFQICKNPKTLPCMHMYCAECLKKLVTKESEETVKCLQCSQEHVVPEFKTYESKGTKEPIYAMEEEIDETTGKKRKQNGNALDEVEETEESGGKFYTTEDPMETEEINERETTEYDRCLEQNKGMHDTIGKHDRETTSYEDTISKLKDKDHKLKNLEDSKEQDLNRAYDECLKGHESLTEKIRSLKFCLANKEAECQILRDKCTCMIKNTNLVKDTSMQTEDTNPFLSQIEKQMEEISKLNCQNEDLGKEAIVYVSEIERLNIQLNHHEESKQRQEKQLSEVNKLLECRIDELSSQLDETKQHLLDKNGKINRLEEKLVKVEGENFKLQRQLRELELLNHRNDDHEEMDTDESHYEEDTDLAIEVTGNMAQHSVIGNTIRTPSSPDTFQTSSGFPVTSASLLESKTPSKRNINKVSRNGFLGFYKTKTGFDGKRNEENKPTSREQKENEASSTENKHSSMSKRQSSALREKTSANSDKLNFTTTEGIRVSVYKGDITSQDTDAIVNAANNRLSHGGGIAGAIATAGGNRVQLDSDDIMKRRHYKPLDVSEVVYTKAPDTKFSRLNSKCKYIIHAVGPRWDKYNDKARCKDLLMKTFYNCLETANSLNAESVTIPAISSGISGVPRNTCVKTMYTALVTFSRDRGRKSKLKDVRFVNIDDDTTRDIISGFSRFLEGTSMSTYKTIPSPSTYRPPKKEYGIPSSANYVPAAPSGSGASPKNINPQGKGAPQTTCVQCADGTLGLYRMECGHWYCVSCKDYLTKDATHRKCVSCAEVPPRHTRKQ